MQETQVKYQHLMNTIKMSLNKRLKEQYILFIYRFVEFTNYTICNIDFYRNYERFYWKNRKK